MAMCPLCNNIISRFHVAYYKQIKTDELNGKYLIHDHCGKRYNKKHGLKEIWDD